MEIPLEILKKIKEPAPINEKMEKKEFNKKHFRHKGKVYHHRIDHFKQGEEDPTYQKPSINPKDIKKTLLETRREKQQKEEKFRQAFNKLWKGVSGKSIKEIPLLPEEEPNYMPPKNIESIENKKNKDISDKDYERFVDKNIVPRPVLKRIARKIIEGKVAPTKRELAIHQAKTSEIEEIINEMESKKLSIDKSNPSEIKTQDTDNSPKPDSTLEKGIDNKEEAPFTKENADFVIANFLKKIESDHTKKLDDFGSAKEVGDRLAEIAKKYSLPVTKISVTENPAFKDPDSKIIEGVSQSNETNEVLEDELHADAINDSKEEFLNISDYTESSIKKNKLKGKTFLEKYNRGVATQILGVKLERAGIEAKSIVADDRDPSLLKITLPNDKMISFSVTGGQKIKEEYNESKTYDEFKNLFNSILGEISKEGKKEEEMFTKYNEYTLNRYKEKLKFKLTPKETSKLLTDEQKKLIQEKAKVENFEEAYKYLVEQIALKKRERTVGIDPKTRVTPKSDPDLEKIIIKLLIADKK